MSNDAMREALRRIAEQDVTEISYDPEWPRVVARKALAAPAQSEATASHKVTHKNGKVKIIDRAPDSYELRECAIEPLPAQSEAKAVAEPELFGQIIPSGAMMWFAAPDKRADDLMAISVGGKMIAKSHRELDWQMSMPSVVPAQSEAKPVYPVYQIHSVDCGWEDVDIAEYEEWAYKKRIVYSAPPSAAPAHHVAEPRNMVAPAGDGGDADEPFVPELPERVIDQLWQAAGLIDEGADGDQLQRLYVYARNVAKETVARIPARHAPTGVDAPTVRVERVSVRRAIRDAIRRGYDEGYNNARNAAAVSGDSAPGYNGRDWPEGAVTELLGTLGNLGVITDAPVAANTGADAPATSESGNKTDIILTGYQLASALELIAPDAVTIDLLHEQMETQASIGIVDKLVDDDGETSGPALCVWCTDYPEEGVTPLYADSEEAQAAAKRGGA